MCLHNISCTAAALLESVHVSNFPDLQSAVVACVTEHLGVTSSNHGLVKST